jgi:hypothetical protein
MSNVMDYPGVDDMNSGFLTEEMGHSHDDTLDGVIDSAQDSDMQGHYLDRLVNSDLQTPKFRYDGPGTLADHATVVPEDGTPRKEGSSLLTPGKLPASVVVVSTTVRRRQQDGHSPLPAQTFTGVPSVSDRDRYFSRDGVLKTIMGFAADIHEVPTLLL